MSRGLLARLRETVIEIGNAVRTFANTVAEVSIRAARILFFVIGVGTVCIGLGVVASGQGSSHFPVQYDLPKWNYNYLQHQESLQLQREQHFQLELLPPSSGPLDRSTGRTGVLPSRSLLPECPVDGDSLGVDSLGDPLGDAKNPLGDSSSPAPRP